MTLFDKSSYIISSFELISRKSMSTKYLCRQHRIIVHLMAICLCDGRKLDSQLKYHFGNKNVFATQIHWELNWSNQWDQRLVRYIRDELLIPPPAYSKKSLNLANKYDQNSPWKHQGQYGEALAVEYLHGLHKIENRNGHNFIERKPGFFIEAGALDGELISNTMYLELKYNWTGLLVEPNPAYLKPLISKRRNAWIFPSGLPPTQAPVGVLFDAGAE